MIKAVIAAPKVRADIFIRRQQLKPDECVILRSVDDVKGLKDIPVFFDHGYPEMILGSDFPEFMSYILDHEMMMVVMQK